jgi:hypothetical protein
MVRLHPCRKRRLGAKALDLPEVGNHGRHRFSPPR